MAPDTPPQLVAFYDTQVREFLSMLMGNLHNSSFPVGLSVSGDMILRLRKIYQNSTQMVRKTLNWKMTIFAGQPDQI